MWTLLLLITVCGITEAFPQTPPAVQKRFLMQQLYGEWMVCHSTDPLQMNSMIIYLYPDYQIEMIRRHSIGPFITESRSTGSISIPHLECSVSLEDKVSEFHPICQDRIAIRFQEKRNSVVSIFGISFVLSKKQDISPRIVCMDLHLIGRDDIYLTTPKTGFHLIRSRRMNLPSGTISFSSLLATQLIGLFICKIVDILIHSIHSS